MKLITLIVACLLSLGQLYLSTGVNEVIHSNTKVSLDTIPLSLKDSLNHFKGNIVSKEAFTEYEVISDGLSCDETPVEQSEILIERKRKQRTRVKIVTKKPELKDRKVHVEDKQPIVKSTRQINIPSHRKVAQINSRKCDYFTGFLEENICQGMSVPEEKSSEKVLQPQQQFVDDLVKEVESGLLTASEWNDLDNWTDWKELTEDGVYTSMLDYWKLPMGRRVSVFVTNEKHLPLPNSQVTLVGNKGQELWKSITDHKGKAELWLPAKAQAPIEMIVTGIHDEESLSLDLSEHRIDKQVVLNSECEAYNTVDIMFLVDATGSMEDEISYLKAELSDVISRVTAQEEVELRTGSVFYKDKWDDYLTAETALHADKEVTLSFMAKRTIGGGGDYAEAVDAGLEKALNQDWNPEALNRIIFLLLDAPPHDDPEVLKKLEQQVRRAATKGIKIVPITASGIDRETEYLMKQMAMMTNGTYVFLTDDSGIGETHLVHAIPDYDVEPLNDLLLRLISNYSNQISCDMDFVNQVQDENPISKLVLDLKVYPNPAQYEVQVESSVNAGMIEIYSSTGKRVKRIPFEDQTLLEIDVSDLVAGMYRVSLVYKGQVQVTQSLVVIS